MPNRKVRIRTVRAGEVMEAYDGVSHMEATPQHDADGTPYTVVEADVVLCKALTPYVSYAHAIPCPVGGYIDICHMEAL